MVILAFDHCPRPATRRYLVFGPLSLLLLILLLRVDHCSVHHLLWVDHTLYCTMDKEIRLDLEITIEVITTSGEEAEEETS